MVRVLSGLSPSEIIKSATLCVSAFVTSVWALQMASASSTRWGRPKVRRRGGASLTASKASSPSSATAKWYSGVVAAPMIAFAHGMNVQPNKRLDSAPDMCTSAQTCEYCI